MDIDVLPDVVLTKIVLLLPARDVFSCAKVCAKWREIVCDVIPDKCWREIVLSKDGGQRENEECSTREQQNVLPVPHASWPSIDFNLPATRRSDDLGRRNNYLDAYFCYGLHMRWRQEQVHSACLMYTTLASAPNYGSYKPLPVSLSLEHHYNTKARQHPFAADIKISNRYALIRVSPSMHPCVIDLRGDRNYSSNVITYSGDINSPRMRTVWLQPPGTSQNDGYIRPTQSYMSTDCPSIKTQWGAMAMCVPLIVCFVDKMLSMWWIDSHNRQRSISYFANEHQGVHQVDSRALELSSPYVLERFCNKKKNEELLSLECLEIHSFLASSCHRIVYGCSSGKINVFTIHGSSGSFSVAESSAKLEVRKEGMPTALEISNESNRVIVGSSSGRVFIFSVTDDHKRKDCSNKETLILETSFSTVSTPIIQIKCCHTGGSLKKSLVVLNSADKLGNTETSKRGDKDVESTEKRTHTMMNGLSLLENSCEVCKTTRILREKCRERTHHQQQKPPFSFDNLEQYWPNLATKKLAVLAQLQVSKNKNKDLKESVAERASETSYLYSHMLHVCQPNISNLGKDNCKHCLSTLSMWYEDSQMSSSAWYPCWSRFVPESQSLSTSYESFICVSGIAATLLIDGNGKVIRKLPNHEVDSWTIMTRSQSSESPTRFSMRHNNSAEGSTEDNHRPYSHLNGRVLSCNAWCINQNSGFKNFQLISATEIEFETSKQRTLSIQLHAPDEHGTIKNLTCNCGYKATRCTRTVHDISNYSEFDNSRPSEAAILSRSSRHVYCCSRLLPGQKGERKRRCDYLQLFD